MGFWHVYLGIYGGGGTAPSDVTDSFTVALVPDGGCDDPPGTNDESGACYPLAFGAKELRGLRFGTMIADTTPEFGARELRGLRFGRMRHHR